ncbi:hypothetical protein PV703_27920 [Streptomyces sp. ME01-24h]|nr:hypothetical protein [Streptomyces sp. ME01-24h]
MPAACTCPDTRSPCSVRADYPERVTTDDEPRAICVHCGDPTEHPDSQPGLTLCPVCTWHEAQRTACSG